MKNNIEINYATMENLDSWLNLIDIVSNNFPGLETTEKIDNYRNTVIKNINRRSAICAVSENKVVGFLLFSTRYNMLCHLAVHPDYRRKRIATSMIELMLKNLDRSRDIVVLTFREDDEKGVAPRILYKQLGFEEAELCYDQEYPEQKFILRGKLT